ncbi:histidinol-phosphatase HisJ [Candidatus Bathyarchaeota archaeon]|nr:histidinol-phosphatase HisJ [Candidatus Bathyarchaeota archaeon]
MDSRYHKLFPSSVTNQPVLDHHVHTKRCRHAEGIEEDYILAAIRENLKVIGFNEHFPMSYLPRSIPVEEYAMDLEEFPEYIKEATRLREAYKEEITVKISTEVDYFEPAWKQIVEFLKPFLDQLDYIYGSVHVVDDWAVDDERFSNKWQDNDKDIIYGKYYKALIAMVRRGYFDVVGHLDLPKKFGHHPSAPMDGILDVLLDAIKENDMVIEVNTAGLRKPIREIYPSRTILENCFEKDIKITLGSDAHEPSHVGYEFNSTIEFLKEIGFEGIYTFNKRQKEFASFESMDGP